MKNINFRQYIKLALRTLQLTFIILKLTKVINWSWWLVLLPTISVIGILGSSLLLLKFLVLIKIKQLTVTNDLKNKDLEDLYKDLKKYAKDNKTSIVFVVIKAVEEFLNKEKLKNTK